MCTLLAKRLDGSNYTRKIILTLQGSGKVVLFGIVRINLDYCSHAGPGRDPGGTDALGTRLDRAQRAAADRGDRVSEDRAGPPQLQWFRLERPQPFFGRLGFIYCDDRPAVELLEIVVDR